VKYHEFSSLFDGEPAHLALLSTYQFDPDFFERRLLLRCPALAKARRIAVFMDAGRWREMLGQDVPARLLNRRYLVVPVRVARGVFHPKLNLLLTERGGQVHCGSANLTRCGCSSNLELLNAIPFGGEGDDEEVTLLAREAFEFFSRACADAEGEPGHVGREWLGEAAECFPWLKMPPSGETVRRVQLLHTYDGSLWDRLAAVIDAAPPTRLLVISPFHDSGGEMFRRVRSRWPNCQVEVLVQQKITTLPLHALPGGGASVGLSELENSKRRLHAKLLAWEADGNSGCLVGSANFTAAAFDARNVEACLLLADAEEGVESLLFDKELSKRPLRFEDFEPGSEKEPAPGESASAGLKLTSALLLGDGQLRVGYEARLDRRPETLWVALRTPGEPLPRAQEAVPNQESGTATVAFAPAALRDAHGTVLASLVARFPDGQQESAPVWVIQEGRLTYEPAGEGASSAKHKVQETGEGLAELLDEIGKREGVAAVIEFLRQLRIKFNDGGGGLPVGRKFRLRLRDPFQADVAPEWLLRHQGQADDLASAITDFVERHIKGRLVRHARRGNVNGMENFLDVFTAVVRLVYVYHRRGVVKRGELIGSVIRCVEVATAGVKANDLTCGGYLQAVADNLQDEDLLQQASDTTNFAGHVRAALMIAQRIRFDPNESDHNGPPPERPRECLPALSSKVRKAFAEAGLGEPSSKDILEALEQYRMFTERELSELGAEFEERTFGRQDAQ
jgi:hypothetical protein